MRVGFKSDSFAAESDCKLELDRYDVTAVTAGQQLAIFLWNCDSVEWVINQSVRNFSIFAGIRILNFPDSSMAVYNKVEKIVQRKLGHCSSELCWN